MMRKIIIIYLFLASCNNNTACGPDINSLPVYSGDAYAFPEVTLASKDLRQYLGLIEICFKSKYRNKIISYNTHYLSARKKRNKILLVFDIPEVSDKEIVYEIDINSKKAEAYLNGRR